MNYKSLAFYILLFGILLSLNACIKDTCEGSAFYERAIQVIFLEGQSSQRISDIIQVSIDGVLDTIVEDGILDLDEWGINRLNVEETVDFDSVYVQEYELVFINSLVEAEILNTALINLEYTIFMECQYPELSSLIVRYNGQEIFNGDNSASQYYHQIRIN